MQALLLLSVLAALLPLRHCVSPTEPTFLDIKAECQGAQCAKGQWNVGIALSDPSVPGAWTPLYAGNATEPLGTCSTPALGACFGSGKPLGNPIQVLGDSREMRVTYTWKSAFNSMVLFNRTSMVPDKLSFKLCYSDVSFADRAWRKKNKPYPRLTQNCPFSVEDVGLPATINPATLSQADKDSLSGNFVYEFKDDTMVSSTLFLMMWVMCGGEVCAFESLESPFYSVPSRNILQYPPQYKASNPAPYNVPGPYNGTYIQVKGYNPITPGMTAGAIVLSVFGPLFFICYYIADHIVYTKTGKALAW